ncbi:hypothetical protein HJG60_009999 [Phyllostomus discolor]|uniref:Uncharacterized protein n=1 Tax=Phyllostomus discolor TaxID=89673 RepID=A0A833YFT3_9CHIR|nr:hypothetical protein HJG60_009999 [Phyllostomus discolor]
MGLSAPGDRPAWERAATRAQPRGQAGWATGSEERGFPWGLPPHSRPPVSWHRTARAPPTKSWSVSGGQGPGKQTPWSHQQPRNCRGQSELRVPNHGRRGPCPTVQGARGSSHPAGRWGCPGWAPGARHLARHLSPCLHAQTGPAAWSAVHPRGLSHRTGARAGPQEGCQSSPGDVTLLGRGLWRGWPFPGVPRGEIRTWALGTPRIAGHPWPPRVRLAQCVHSESPYRTDRTSGTAVTTVISDILIWRQLLLQTSPFIIF